MDRTTALKTIQKGLESVKSGSKAEAILREFLTGGKSKGQRPAEMDLMTPDETEEAINVETEHTGNRDLAEKIVWDHVAEHGAKYYPALKEMEKQLRGAE